jgi:hypothetical protein
MVRPAKCTRKNKKTLKAKKNSTKRLRKNKKTRRNVKKHRRYGGAPPTDEIASTDEKEIPQTEESEECAICKERHDDDVIINTECGHSFHKKCLARWCNIQSSDANKTCPMCRANIASLCNDIGKKVNSLGIMKHLDAMFFDIGSYTDRDVESRRLENNRIIHEYLDNPEFDPNVYDNENKTPLYAAIERSRNDVVDKLLKRPDINTEIRETRSDKTPLELAIANRNFKAIALFKKYKKVPKALKGLV